MISLYKIDYGILISKETHKNKIIAINQIHLIPIQTAISPFKNPENVQIEHRQKRALILLSDTCRNLPISVRCENYHLSLPIDQIKQFENFTR